ncbi:MAG: Eco57I restriction-modification methylase domain-containing protein [Nitrospirota bacterium]
MDFQKSYDVQEFITFLNNFLPDDFEQREEPINFNDLSFTPDRIKSVRLMGAVPSLGDLRVYEIRHESESDPRVTLSRETFRLMSNFGVRKSLAVFVSENSPNYRFSLVTIDLRLEGSHVAKEYSNPRRYSFFLGPDAKVHTPNQFLIQKGKIKDSNDLQSRFSIEVVTKEFFSELSKWYYWAVEKARFPKDAEKEKNGRNIAVIRLITRLVFIWFMRERGLVPPYLFDKNRIAALLKDLSPENTTYYKAILQNLFFATLNTKQNERVFRFQITGSKNSSYMKHGVYRYENYFKNQEDMLEIFKDIPFLNGGLFDCLDRPSKENDGQGEVRIDGFSDEEKGLQIPNFLFFSDETNTRGIIDLLQTYNFTIDESTPVDVEIALDPELLGRVFENLLASYNQETATTKRKSTGSYYTPREIVDYMVTQSLKEYFKTHLTNIEGIDDKLASLFSHDNQENPFSNDASRLVYLIDNLRIVDPAVGSGAFPMGILNKLVFILSKLDPENTFWKQAQINAVEQSVPDPKVKQNLKCQIEKYFQEKNPDYGRKLYLIQKCIYGVDIEQIAVEIANLRFFISLLIDEKMDKSKDNWDIEPLPNLDFKIMQGNSLISSFAGIDFDRKAEDKGQVMLDLTPEYSQIIKQFEEAKREYQNEPDRDKKDKLREKIERLLWQILEEKVNKHLPQIKRIEEKYAVIPNPSQRAQQIADEKQNLFKKLSFDPEQAKKDLIAYTEGRKQKDFFLWDVYFAEVFYEKEGFDVVIANPPYDVVSDNRLRKLFNESIYGRANLYGLFIHKAIRDILCENGILTFINPKTLLADAYFTNLRKYLRNNGEFIEILKIIDRHRVFDEVLQACIIIIYGKTKPQTENQILVTEIGERKDIGNPAISLSVSKNKLYQREQFDGCFFCSNKIESYTLWNKVISSTKPLSSFGFSFTTGKIQWDLFKDYLVEKSSKGTVRLIWAENIQRYAFKRADKRKGKEYLENPPTEPSITSDTIITQRTTADEQEYRIIATVFSPAEFGFQSFSENHTNYLEKKSDRLHLNYVLACLNSNLYDFIFRHLSSNTQVSSGQLNSLPFRDLPMPNQKPFIELVNRILVITKDEDYLRTIHPLTPASGGHSQKQAQVAALEREIDQLVYNLYGLTEEEIWIVEGGCGG